MDISTNEATITEDAPQPESSSLRSNNPTTHQGLEDGHHINTVDTKTLEPMAGWLYIGHGEWTLPEQITNTTTTTHKNSLNSNKHRMGEAQQEVMTLWEPRWIQKWRAIVDKDITLHKTVLDKSYPNRFGAQIPLQTKWNLDRMEVLLNDYEDKEVVEWMRYGWPSGRLPTMEDPQITTQNH